MSGAFVPEHKPATPVGARSPMVTAATARIVAVLGTCAQPGIARREVLRCLELP